MINPTPQEPIVARVPVYSLPVPFDDDLVLDFRNRDRDVATDHPDAYPDYPPGVTGTLTIYNDLKTEGVARLSKTVAASGSHCVIKLDSLELATVQPGTLWRFRLRFPDPDLPGGGYDKRIVNGRTVRDDGRAWA